MLLIAVSGPVSASAQTRLEVTVTGFSDHRGEVRVGLFSSEIDYPKKASTGKVMAVTADSVILVFEELPPGAYAISVFHDRNADGKLDTNLLGIPREGFAFGNNAMGMFGPPSFEKASVNLGKDPVRQVLRIRYF